ncbi:hypothetical protein LCGC14_1599810 [marine sediment metagenome]|uniref:Uncharacterized protein n=1 Tax=marine sediment metagenome TaxID=412755 RepID=A0A0F9IXY1_9ZZZZ
MSRDLDTLVPEFRGKVDLVLASCEEQGITMRPFFTERTPWAQARIYRSTRGTGEIVRTANRMRASGAPYLAGILEGVGPQYSPPSSRGHLTNAAPGLSWHQWGMAVDCFWLLDGAAIWSIKHTIIRDDLSINGYFIYGDEAVSNALLSAGMAWGWDWPHIQLTPDGSPHDVYAWRDLDSQMRNKFGTTEVS